MEPEAVDDFGVIETEPLIVLYAGFAPDGHTLATVSFDGPKDNCSLWFFPSEAVLAAG
jgi:hypothetical protein